MRWRGGIRLAGETAAQVAAAVAVIWLLSLLLPVNTHSRIHFLTPQGGGCPETTPNVLDGPDPWGGCFPGPQTTGVPSGTQLTEVTSAAQQPPYEGLEPDNTGWIWSTGDSAIKVMTSGAVVDAVQESGGIIINSGVTGVTVKNSQIDGIIKNYGDGTSSYDHDTLNGGTQALTPTLWVPHATVQYSDIEGGKDAVNCAGDGCDVENSYLDSQYDGGSSAHQQGYFSNGGTDNTLIHDTIRCTPTSGACTADVTLSNAYAIDNFLVKRNLILHENGHALYCVYPGPNSNPLTNPVGNLTWQENVFQKGPNGKCGDSAAVYDWQPQLCLPADSCVWTGNVWDDGTPISP